MGSLRTGDGSAITPAGGRRGQSRVVRIAKKFRTLGNRILEPFSLVGNHPLPDPTLFPWISELLASVPAIRAEAERIMRHQQAMPPLRDFAPGHERITTAEAWRSFFLWGYGYPAPENLARCPETARAVTRIPGMVTAMYSVMTSGAHVLRHKGVTKAMLTLHIGLMIPRDATRCRMDVDGHEVVWREGKPMVFDDTYPHEVWNDTAESRVILLIQFLRPLRQPGKAIARALFWAIQRTGFVQRARRNLSHWERLYAAAERR